VFNIEKPVDAAGKVVEPEVKFEPGLVSHPHPYRASIRPMSNKHDMMIRKAEEKYPWEENVADALTTVKW
jgi:hypothetical protein